MHHRQRTPAPAEPLTLPVVVLLEGELDVASRPRTAAQLLRALDTGSRRLVVDLSAVTFADCTGLLPLVDLDASLRRRGGYVRVRTVPGLVARVAAWNGLAEQPGDPAGRRAVTCGR
jgi:stage II sporulation protein AA (anti-sigma F factor antagonist)